MSAHRYWRVVNVVVDGGGALELSEVRAYVDGALADAATPVAATIAPNTGLVADLADDSAADACVWSAAQMKLPGWSLVWDFGSGNDVELSNIRLGSGATVARWPRSMTVQYSDDGESWVSAAQHTPILYPGGNSLTEEPTPSVGGDPYLASVMLLASGDGTPGDTVAPDLSTRHVLTKSGSADLSATQSKYGGTSMYLNGGYFGEAPSTDYAFGTGDFTIEWWGWKSTSGGYDEVCGCENTNGSGTNGWVVECSSSRGVYMFADNGGIEAVINYPSTPGGFNDSTWHHWAITREGTTAKLWKDGLEVYSGTSTKDIRAYGPFGIGGSSVSTTYRYFGYIDDLRITKGVARYSSTFTPPGALEYTGGGDPDFASVVLLAHLDAADGSSTFLDSSLSAHTITADNGAVHSNAQGKWGATSFATNGANSGPRLSLANSSDFAFGSGDFTLEAWSWKSSQKANAFLFSTVINGSANGGYWIDFESDKFTVYCQGVSVVEAAAAGTSASAWAHWAVSRSAGTIRLFKNGTQIASAASAHDFISTYPRIGGTEYNSGYNVAHNGYINDLRITKGVGRYTASFTPPSGPFPDDAGGVSVAFLPLDFATPRRAIGDGNAAGNLLGGAGDGGDALLEDPFDFFDANDGGDGVISGTVKEDDTPTDNPLRRRVLLIEERSRRVVRVTWSDAATGAYSFVGVNRNNRYTALAYDHEHNYRAVAADNLEPEPA